MIKIDRKDGKGQVWTNGIQELNCYECENHECDDLYHYDILTSSGQMVGVSRAEFYKVAELLSVDIGHVPMEKVKQNKKRGILQ